MLPGFEPDAFRLDRGGGVPIGTQLAWRLRRLIATGRLRPGDRLPSVRDLAEAAEVNVNTVRSVYGRLEDAGYVVSRQGSGTFVAVRPRSSDRLDRLERVAAELDEGARRAGLDPHDVAAHLFSGTRTEPAATHEPAAVSDEAEARQRLRQQIATLEAQLVRHPAAARSGPRSARRAAGIVLTAEELEAVRDDLRDRLRAIEAAREDVVRQLEAVEAGRAERRAARRPERPSASSPSLTGARVRWVGVE